MRLVIAGNGPAALSAVESIRKINQSAEIILLTPEREKAYSPCFLYRYVSGELSKDKLYIQEEDFYEKKRVKVLYGVALKGIKPSEKQVKLSNGESLPYDKLLLAIGASPFLPKVEGLEGEEVFFFKTLEDAEKLKEASTKIREAVVIGGGFIGLEAAEALTKRGLTVRVIEKEETLLPRSLSGDLAERLKDYLEKKGVHIFTGQAVRRIKRVRGKIKAVELSDGTEIPAQVVVVSIGVTPNTGPVEGAGIKIDRGIVVNEKMETSIPDIYAAGDVAEQELKGQRRLNPIWINATLGGAVAGANMVGQERKLDYFVPSVNLINLFGLYIFSAGSPEGKDFITWERGSSRGKVVLDQNGKIVGLQIIGPESLRGSLYLNLLERKWDVF